MKLSLFLIIIIALALFSFVLSGLFDGNLFNKTASNVGEVNGEPIKREEFAASRKDSWPNHC